MAQPYGLGQDDVAQLGELAASDEWHLSVATSWYGYGTVAVELWRADVYSDYLSDPRSA